MRIFIDTEFTDLRQSARLISLSLVSECGKSFYAVFNDFELQQCSPFVKETIIPDIQNIQQNNTLEAFKIKDNTLNIVSALKTWLNQFEAIQMWADVPHYDWVLFCELFGGALHIPEHIHYMCMDLSSLLLAKNCDYNKKRIDLIDKQDIPEDYVMHNALSDAQVGMCILKKLLNKKI